MPFFQKNESLEKSEKWLGIIMPGLVSSRSKIFRANVKKINEGFSIKSKQTRMKYIQSQNVFRNYVSYLLVGGVLSEYLFVGAIAINFFNLILLAAMPPTLSLLSDKF